MRLTFSVFLAFFTSALLYGQRSDNAIGVRGVLVSASPAPGATDERLKPYEANLRKILRFESFKFLGEGRASVGSPGQASIMLGQGHKLEIHAESASDGRRVQLNWLERGQSLMRTGLVLRPGVPAVLGGPARGDSGEVYALIVVAD
jgi:hypothetical protein